MTPEYFAWRSARGRYTNPKDRAYRSYGGRGIEFRFKSFAEFMEELGPRLSPAHSLDRINNDGHYERGNVRWATRKEQANNRRPIPDEARARIAATQRGRKDSIETRMKKSKPRSDETRLKMSIACARRKRDGCGKFING